MTHRARPAGWIIARVNQLLFGVDIDPTARIAPGCVLRHPHSIVIGAEAVIEPGVRIFHGVTLGKRLSGGPGRPDGIPYVERNCLIGTGAVLLGPIIVGAGTQVGANVVLTESVPANSVVRPAVPEILTRRLPQQRVAS